ncbi:MAG: sporulation integral membrane protein YlbJ [Desulfotomaculales bacterium]
MLTSTLLLISLIAYLAFNKRTPFPGQKMRRRLTHLFFSLCALTVTAGMLTQPKTVYQGSLTGLNLWWNIVFPSLLPFFIICEILLSLGIVHFLGVLLEPVMRPLFNVPGAGSFVLAVGYTSGYPIGAMITARLRKEGLCTRREAERLMSFTNNSSPLFMLVAVAVGMFNNPQLGPLIAAAHYTANLTLGLALRFYGRKDPETATLPPAKETSLKRAFAEMFAAYEKDRRPPGKILADAVRNAVTNLLNIGGFIILFAVLIQLLTSAGIIGWLAHKMGLLLIPLGFSDAILPALASGLVEMTIGTKMASEAAAPLLQQVIAASMILAWGGLSIHAQAASMIAETDIRLLPFILSRFAHALLAALYTYLFFNFLPPAVFETLAKPELITAGQRFSLWPEMPASLLAFLLLTGCLLLAAVVLHLKTSLRLIFLRIR